MAYVNLNKPRNIFNPDNVIDSSGPGSLAAIKKFARDGRLIDFCPDIGMKDEHILEAWMRYFNARLVPWAVTPRANDSTRRVLWKQDVTLIWTKGGRYIKDPKT